MTGKILAIILIGMMTFSTLVKAEETNTIPAPVQDKGDYEARYLEILSDVPLMQGLEHVPESTLVFDKPDGRIAESAYFSESVTAEEIVSYYNEVLPQLGWQLLEPLKFAREKDQLTFDPSQNGEESVVIFYLSPLENISQK